MIAPFSNLYGKIWVGFCLNTLFLRGFILQQQERHRFFWKTALALFKIALRLRDQHAFMWHDFNILTLTQIFWKTKTFLKKLEYSFLVESNKIENAIFLYKTALSSAIVKTNGIVTTKWNKNGDLLVTTLFFWKFSFSIRTSYKELIWCSNYPNVHIHTYRKRWSFIWGCFFPVSILNPLSSSN